MKHTQIKKVSDHNFNDCIRRGYRHREVWLYVVTADEAGRAWQRLILSPRMRLRATKDEAKGRLCHRG